jgi:hypothetical protein
MIKRTVINLRIADKRFTIKKITTTEMRLGE